MQRPSKQPKVSYLGMKRSARVLRDFVQVYVPLHQLSIAGFFEHYPLLGYVEALFYQADDELEAGRIAEAPYARKKKVITALLEELGLIDDQILVELDNGEAYVDQENELMHGGDTTIEAVSRAASLRTFDLRLLHRLLLKSMGQPYDEALFELLQPIETLEDIEDDIVQYSDDVAHDDYNTYRMYIHLYGDEARERLQGELDRFEQLFGQRLSTYPEDQQQRFMEIMASFQNDNPRPPIPDPLPDPHLEHREAAKKPRATSDATVNLEGLHHLAIIPDGNRRWAKARGLSTEEGHRRGFLEVSPPLFRSCWESGIHTMTLWLFSTENWKRSDAEVGYLMRIYDEFLAAMLEVAEPLGVRMCHLGRRDRIPPFLLERIEAVEAATRQLERHTFNFALDYGGRDEIFRAAQKLRDLPSPEDVLDQELLGAQMDTGHQRYPDPDLIIRTSGERRISGFLPWQGCYSELSFLDMGYPSLDWPTVKEEAVRFHSRHRGYGK